jgi:hypothetical protein
MDGAYGLSGILDSRIHLLYEATEHAEHKTPQVNRFIRSIRSALF